MVTVADGGPIVTLDALPPTSTPVVLGGVKVSKAATPAESLMVAPVRAIFDAEVIPSVSASEACAITMLSCCLL